MGINLAYRRAEYKRINSSPSTIKRLYTVKNVYYGSHIESTEYFKVQATFNATRLDYSKAQSGQKKSYSLRRAKDRIYKLIEANIGRFGDYKPIFFTLTTKDQCTEYKQSNRKIKALIRRLNLYTKLEIKYVAVPELHTSGAIHYHGVFFNLPFIDIQYFYNYLWGYGHVDLQVSKSIDSMGAYLAKYITEDFSVNTPLHTKTYMASRGLYTQVDVYTTEIPQYTTFKPFIWANNRIIKRHYVTDIQVRKKYQRYLRKKWEALQLRNPLYWSCDVTPTRQSNEFGFYKLQGE